MQGAGKRETPDEHEKDAPPAKRNAISGTAEQKTSSHGPSNSVSGDKDDLEIALEALMDEELPTNDSDLPQDGNGGVAATEHSTGAIVAVATGCGKDLLADSLSATQTMPTEPQGDAQRSSDQTSAPTTKETPSKCPTVEKVTETETPHQASDVAPCASKQDVIATPADKTNETSGAPEQSFVTPGVEMPAEPARKVMDSMNTSLTSSMSGFVEMTISSAPEELNRGSNHEPPNTSNSVFERDVADDMKTKRSEGHTCKSDDQNLRTDTAEEQPTIDQHLEIEKTSSEMNSNQSTGFASTPNVTSGDGNDVHSHLQSEGGEPMSTTTRLPERVPFLESPSPEGLASENEEMVSDEGHPSDSDFEWSFRRPPSTDHPNINNVLDSAAKARA